MARPLGEGGLVELAAHSNAASRPRGNAAILVVDDYPANIVALRAVLEPLGQPLVMVHSGEEAVNRAREDDFAVVLMDVKLPGMDGVEAAAAIRRFARTRSVPIIFLTGVDRDPAEILRGYAQGGVDYIVKPFDANILRSKVAVFVDLYVMREQMKELAHADALRSVAEAERARLFSLLMQAPVAIAILEGPDHVFTLANALLCEMVNRTSLTGKRYRDAFPELAGTPLTSIFDGVYQTGQPFATNELPLPLERDGVLEDRFFKFSLEPLRDASGRVYGQIGVAIDITAQVLARREVEAMRAKAQQAERYFRTLVDSIPTLAWSSRADGWVDYFNQRWYSYTGTTAEQMEGNGWHSVHDPAELPKVMERWQHSIATGEPFEMRFPLKRHDGVFRWFLTRVEPVRDETGATTRWFGTCTDVDDQQRTEQNLEAAVVREKSAREEAERAVRTNELFVGILSHDLRNPMSAIAMGASLLLRSVSSAKEMKVTRRIADSAERMARMTDQLLDFTRIRVGGGLGLSREHIDLYDLCRSVVAELETAHPESTLLLQAEGDNTFGEWDHDRLFQALSNLVGNAIAHGTLGRPITVVVAGGGESVSVSLHNEGVVPAELIPVLFDPFRGTHRRARKGLGLGLYITEQIVLAHGGTIDVDSSEASGTTFRIKLPRA